ncbi:MAG: iron-sulfur cluster assembly protein [Verrucomicrobia bacterium]|nr:iron-sulfur cluster assembly protein [Verrucomicrobiota bacterium]
MKDRPEDRVEQVRAALETVTDPEIDESVTSLEFISALEVGERGEVSIEFRLPTYWCAPNFAFLMASDMRDAVGALSWVQGVSVKLLDHFSAGLINRGVALKQGFREAFPGESDDDLAVVRQKFLGKSFERRQELLVRHLLERGQRAEGLTALSLRGLLGLALEAEGDRLRALYAFAWRRLWPAWGEERLAFVTLDGQALVAGELSRYLRRLAGVRRNAEFNGGICRSLLAERKADLLTAT